MDHDVDDLLRRNAERQLAGFDRDRQRQMVMHRLTAAPAQKLRRIVVLRIAAGAAAVLMLAVGFISMSLPEDAGRDAAPMGAASVRESVGNDLLLASTDATTILLTGAMQMQVSNDPMLVPHSLWDQ